MKQTILIVAALSVSYGATSSCQKRDVDVSFTAALEESQEKNFDWSTATTSPTITPKTEPIILGTANDLYLGRGPWQQSACSPIYTDKPSEKWDVLLQTGDEAAELEIEVRHCGVDDRGPWLTLTGDDGASTKPLYLPRDGGQIKISNFYVGQVGPNRRLKLTIVSEGQDFLVTGLRILSTGSVELISDRW